MYIPIKEVLATIAHDALDVLDCPFEIAVVQFKCAAPDPAVNDGTALASEGVPASGRSRVGSPLSSRKEDSADSRKRSWRLSRAMSNLREPERFSMRGDGDERN
jgi:hypothetical protein